MLHIFARIGRTDRTTFSTATLEDRFDVIEVWGHELEDRDEVTRVIHTRWQVVPGAPWPQERPYTATTDQDEEIETYVCPTLEIAREDANEFLAHRLNFYRANGAYTELEL